MQLEGACSEEPVACRPYFLQGVCARSPWTIDESVIGGAVAVVQCGDFFFGRQNHLRFFLAKAILWFPLMNGVVVERHRIIRLFPVLTV